MPHHLMAMQKPRRIWEPGFRKITMQDAKAMIEMAKPE